MRGLDKDINRWNNPDYGGSKRTAMFALRGIAVAMTVDLIYLTAEIISDNMARGVMIGGLGGAALIAGGVVADKIIGHQNSVSEDTENARVLELSSKRPGRTHSDPTN